MSPQDIADAIGALVRSCPDRSASGIAAFTEKVNVAVSCALWQLSDVVVADTPTAEDRDFAVDSLTGVAKDLALVVTALLTARLGRAPSGGGCRAFYSPEEWRDRGESYGRDSALILCYDGGDLAPFCNYDYDNPAAMDALADALQKQGYWIEQCTGWYSAVYRL